VELNCLKEVCAGTVPRHTGLRRTAQGEDGWGGAVRL